MDMQATLERLERGEELNPERMPWYAYPRYHAPGAVVVNHSGEQVAEFEDMREAELCVARVNGREA